MPDLCCNRRWLSYFSLSRQAQPRDFWWAVLISSILGALYGSFAAPVWAEAVSFAQAWSGQVDYRHSPWGNTMFGDPSLQIVIPSLMLKYGMDLWHASQIVCAFFCAVSFAAITACCFLFTRHAVASVAFAILLIPYHFIDSHGYPVMYPMSLSQFGQTGQYFCVLAMAALAMGYPRAAGVIGGILAAIHAVWCACFVLAGLPVVILWYRGMLWRLVSFFVICAAAALALQYYGAHSLPAHVLYEGPQVPADAAVKEKNNLDTAAKRKEDTAVKESARTETPGPAKKTRGTFTGHNTLFSDAPSLWKAVFKFFSPTVLLLVLSLFTWRLFLRQPLPASESHVTDIKRFAAMIAIPLLTVTCFKVVEEMDPQFQWLAMVHEKLPDLVLRAIVNRLMNLSTLMIPIVFITMLFLLIRDRCSIVALVTLGMIVMCGWLASWSVMPFNIALKHKIINAAFTLALVLSVLGIERRYLENMRFVKWVPCIFSIAMLAFVVFAPVRYAYHSIKYHTYSSHNDQDEIFTFMQNDPGMLIIGSDQSYDVQIRTRRPIFLPTMVDVYDKTNRKVVHTYCYTDPFLPFAQFYANIKPCFEERSPHEWAVVGRELVATGLLVPDSWKLKIKPTASSGGFNYYHLPPTGEK